MAGGGVAERGDDAGQVAGEVDGGTAQGGGADEYGDAEQAGGDAGGAGEGEFLVAEGVGEQDGEEGGGGVEHRRHAAGNVGFRPGEQGEWQDAVERAEDGELWPGCGAGERFAAGEEDQVQCRGGEADAAEDDGEGRE